MTPHLSEELWKKMGEKKFVGLTSPGQLLTKDQLTDDTITMPIQVNGKRRGQIEVQKKT